MMIDEWRPTSIVGEPGGITASTNRRDESRAAFADIELAIRRLFGKSKRPGRTNLIGAIGLPAGRAGVSLSAGNRVERNRLRQIDHRHFPHRPQGC
jgi:hypothetical protein